MNPSLYMAGRAWKRSTSGKRRQLPKPLVLYMNYLSMVSRVRFPIRYSTDKTNNITTLRDDLIKFCQLERSALHSLKNDLDLCLKIVHAKVNDIFTYMLSLI